MERFLYSVSPKRPIKNLSADIPVLRTPKSLRLSKDEVKKCLKSAIVYRRFANESKLERVTPLTVDRLHNEKFMTEEEYQKFLDAQIDSKNGTVINTSIGTEAVDDTPVLNDELVDEVVEDSEETVETKDPEQSVDETVTEETEEETEAVDGTVDVEAEVETVKESAISEPNDYHKNNYYGGKNRRK